MKLIKFTADYADEFEVSGFRVMTDTQWAEHIRVTHMQFIKEDEIEWYFGSNEFITFEDIDDYLSAFIVIDLTENEVSVLNKLFDGSFGDFPCL